MKGKFRQALRENRWLKAVPNSLTLCNSLCGFAAILVTMHAYKYQSDPARMTQVYAWSAFLILFAMVFDAFDGYAARLFNAASMHGIQMDSLADMTTFGVAPATLVAVMAHNVQRLETPREFIPICVLCGVYLGCAALRLATYNVHAMLEKKSSDRFSGLPSPGGAAAICTIVIFTAVTHGDVSRVLKFLPLYTAVLGLLMVSKVPYLHFAKWLISVKRNRRRLIALIALIALWIASAIAFHPLLFPLALVNLYVLWGPVAYLAVKMGFVRANNPHLRQYSGIYESEPEGESEEEDELK